MKHKKTSLGTFVSVLTAALATACGGDDSKKVDAPVGPSGDVELTITGLFNNDGESFERADADQVFLGCDGAISLDLGPSDEGVLKNWLLKPPGTCGTFVQCGYVELVVDPSSSDSRMLNGATTSFEVTSIDPGRHVFEVTLLSDDGEPFLQEEEPVNDRLEVTLAAASGCESATGGSGGTGGTGGASSSGGTGGSPAGGGAAGEGGAAGAS
jgi:uncharacterized membrane protein YgcG